MKKLLFAGFIFSLAVLIFACNQKDDLALQNDNTELKFTDTNIPGLDDVALVDSDIPDSDIMTIMVDDRYPDGEVPVDETRHREYCRYVIATAAGPNCGTWARNTIICVDCPNGGRCPGVDPPAMSGYQVVDANGVVQCQGQWVRSVNLADPGACIRGCPGGEDGYVFVN